MDNDDDLDALLAEERELEEDMEYEEGPVEPVSEAPAEPEADFEPDATNAADEADEADRADGARKRQCVRPQHAPPALRPSVSMLSCADGALAAHAPLDPVDAVLAAREWHFVDDPGQYVSPFGSLSVHGRLHTPRQGEVTALVAGCGRGKSTTFRRYIEESFDRYPQMRFLFLSANVAFASFLAGELREQFNERQVGYYKEQSVDELRAARIVVCSMESLQKLRGQMFHSIILDEARSLGKLPGGATMAHQGNNIFLLRELCRHSWHVLASDADLLLCYPGEPRPLCVDLFRFLCPDRTVVCQRMTGPGPAHLQRTARLYYDHKSAVRNAEDWMAALSMVARAWRQAPEDERMPFAVCCGSKKQVSAIFQLMKSLDVTCKPYSGASNNSKYVDFRDVAEAWKHVGCVVFTTTLRVGVDVQIEFDRVFWWVQRLGCSVLDQGQAVLRFRRVRHQDLCILLDSCTPPDIRAVEVAAGKKKPLELPTYAAQRTQVEENYGARWKALMAEAATGRPKSVRPEKALPVELLDLFAHAAVPAGGLERRLQLTDVDLALRHVLQHYHYPIVETPFVPPPGIQLVASALGQVSAEVDEDDDFCHGVEQLERCEQLLHSVMETSDDEFFVSCYGYIALPEKELTARMKFFIEVFYATKWLGRFPMNEVGDETATALKNWLLPGVVEGVELRAHLTCRTVAEQVGIDACARMAGDSKVSDCLSTATLGMRMRAAHEVGALLGIEKLWESWELDEHSTLLEHLREERKASRDKVTMAIATQTLRQQLREATRALCQNAPGRTIQAMLNQIALAVGMECKATSTRGPPTATGTRPRIPRSVGFEPVFERERNDWQIWSEVLGEAFPASRWEEAHRDVLADRVQAVAEAAGGYGGPDTTADPLGPAPADPAAIMEDTADPMASSATAAAVVSGAMRGMVDQSDANAPRYELTCAAAFRGALATLRVRLDSLMDEQSRRWKGWLLHAERAGLGTATMQSPNGNTDVLVTPTVYAKRRGIGRRYASGASLQNCPSALRKKLCRNYLHDVDIACCHPTIMLQFALKMGVDGDRLPVLQKLVASPESRESVYASISRHYGATREDTKELVLSILNGGSISEWLRRIEPRRTRPVPSRDEHQVHSLATTERGLVVAAFRRHFHDKISTLEQEFRVERTATVERELANRNAAQTVTARQEAETRLETAQYNATEAAIRRTSFALCLQEIEDKVLDVIDCHFAASGWEVNVLVFDGLMVRHDDKLDLVATMRGAEKAVCEALDYEIRLVEKPLYNPSPPPVVLPPVG